MVRSKLDNTINYKENKHKLFDFNEEIEVYTIELFNNNIDIILSDIQYDYTDKDILYVSIIVLKDNAYQEPIGVYEFPSAEYYSLLEEENISLGKIKTPALTYSYINEEYLKKYNIDDLTDSDSDYKESISSKSVSSNVDDELALVVPDISLNDSDGQLEGIDISANLMNLEHIVDETIDSKSEKDMIIDRIYKEDNEDKINYDKINSNGENEEITKQNEAKFVIGKNWIQQFLKTNEIEIIDNAGGGDCFFYTISDAFKSIDIPLSVQELRTILSKEANEELYEQYSMLFNMYKDEKENLEKELNKIKKQNKELQKKYNISEDKKEKEILYNTSKQLASKFRKIQQQEYREAKDSLEEYDFMNGIDSLDKFRNIITTCKFWAETWAISTLERVLNIKVIVLSEENYRNRNMDNVIQCGQLNDTILEDRGVFKPKYYIIVDWSGMHYKLVEYKGKSILEFEQIPYKIRNMIVDKCIESDAGPYYIIPKFKELKEKYTTTLEPSITTTDDSTPDDSTISNKSSLTGGTNKNITEKIKLKLKNNHTRKIRK